MNVIQLKAIIGLATKFHNTSFFTRENTQHPFRKRKMAAGFYSKSPVWNRVAFVARVTSKLPLALLSKYHFCVERDTNIESPNIIGRNMKHINPSVLLSFQNCSTKRLLVLIWFFRFCKEDFNDSDINHLALQSAVSLSFCDIEDWSNKHVIV